MVNDDVVKHVVGENARRCLAAYGMSGDAVHIIAAVQEYARWGLPLPEALIQLLPEVIAALNGERKRRPYSKDTLRNLNRLRLPHPRSDKLLRAYAEQELISEAQAEATHKKRRVRPIGKAEINRRAKTIRQFLSRK
jgi:hypothetical protein